MRDGGKQKERERERDFGTDIQRQKDPNTQHSETRKMKTQGGAKQRP
jgi:hypothetical protein